MAESTMREIVLLEDAAVTQGLASLDVAFAVLRPQEMAQPRYSPITPSSWILYFRRRDLLLS